MPMIIAKTFVLSTLVAGLLFGTQTARGQSDAVGPIPKSMTAEHEELHSELAHLTQAGGLTGDAAKSVAELLDHHFAKENEYALPPLGLLGPLKKKVRQLMAQFPASAGRFTKGRESARNNATRWLRASARLDGRAICSSASVTPEIAQKR